MSRDKEKRPQNAGTSPLWAERGPLGTKIFCGLSDEVAGHLSLAAVAFHSEIASKFKMERSQNWDSPNFIG